MSISKSLIQIHLSILLFGFSSLFGKFLSLPAIIIVLGRLFFAAISLLIILKISKETLKLKDKKHYLFLGLLGILLAFHWSTFFQSVKLSTVAIATLTFSTFPIFTAFLEPLFFKEKLKLKTLIVAIITFIGIILIIPKFTLDNQVTQGAIWGILSGLSFSILSILNRKFSKIYSGNLIAFYQASAASIVLLPFAFLINFELESRDILLLIILGTVFTGLAHSLFISSLKKLKTTSASITASLEPVYGIILAAMILQEIPEPKTLIGGLVILGATIYESFSSQSKSEKLQI